MFQSKQPPALHPTKVTTVIAELVEQGFLGKCSVNGKQVYRTLHKQGMPDLLRYKTLQTVKMQELKQIALYGEQSDQCRMVILRNALGDDLKEQCQLCDCCLKQQQTTFLPKIKTSFITSWIDKRPVIIASSTKKRKSPKGSAFSTAK